MKEALTFDDVLIVPKFSNISSRKDVDLSVLPMAGVKNGFRKLGISFPVISANMDTVTESEMAKSMLQYGGQACLHRFCTIEENVKMLNDSEYLPEGDEDSAVRPMVSIGLGDYELRRASVLAANNARHFIVDVANGGQKAIVDQVKSLRAMFGRSYNSITVGNFASVESVKQFFELVGYDTVDAIKVGIGPGSACTTRIKTGIGYPQLSAVMEIAEFLHGSDIMIIADGGMRTPGDIAKALGAGASMVMLGGMLSGTHETPGDVYCKVDNTYLKNTIYTGYPLYKKYRGSASKESYAVQNKDASWRTAEGESFYVPLKGSVIEVLKDIEGGLRSALTYTGSNNLKEFQENCEFIKITNAGFTEGTPHGKLK